MARRSEGKRGTRSKATQTSVFEQQRSQTEKIKAKGFAKDFFRRARRDEGKRGTRSKSYADERFEERRSDSGKSRSKKLFENYTEEEMT